MNLPEILLLAAILLGTLAFFEPCTIATNTLFSVRTYRKNTSACCFSLLHVWLSRCLLLTSLFSLAVIFLPTPRWGPIMPSILLSIMALLYLISRHTYLPIPHLSFYRLLPGNVRFSEATRLGLTLPACTLPLLLVVTALAATANSVWFAVLAGLLFATFFTAPLAVASINGISTGGLDLLNRAARGSPYLTAILLLGAALYLLTPELNVDTELLRNTLHDNPTAGIGLAFLAGFVFSLNPRRTRLCHQGA